MDYMVTTLLLLTVSLLSLQMGRRMRNGLVQRSLIIVGKVLMGAVTLVLVNLIGEQVGLTIPVNPFCSLVAGLLGGPGVVLLVALRLLLL